MKLNFKNLSDSIKRIRLIPKGNNFEGASANIGVDNPTLDINEYGEVSFCLAPKEEIEDDDCSSTAITFEIFQIWNGMNESGYEKSIKLYDATTNELLGIGEAPIEANDGEYPNILPDFIDNLNAGNHQITAIRYINNYGYFWGVKLISAAHRKFRLEVFIGNEGGVSIIPDPDTTMNDVGIDDSAAYDHGAVIVNFCLAPAEPVQNIISCEGATDTIFISLFDELRVSGDGWSFIANATDVGGLGDNNQTLLDEMVTHGFAMQDSGDFMGCGDIYRIINMNPTQQRLKFESLNGSNNIEVLPQPNTAWSFKELPSNADQELNVCLAPNATAVPIQGMQATPIMTLFIPNDYIEGDESTALLKFFVNDIPVENIVSGGYNFLASNSAHNNEANNNLRIALSNSLLAYGILVDGVDDTSSRVFSTEEDAYKVVRIECDNKLRDYYMGGSTIGKYGMDSNNTFNIIHNTDELGYKAEFCIVNPQLPEGYPA